MTSDNWDDIAEWWGDAVRDDPTQSDEPVAILTELIEGTLGRTIDLGCGEGQMMRLIGGAVIGTDLSIELLEQAASAGPVVQSSVPDLTWIRDRAFDRAVSVGLLDLLPDHKTFFSNVAAIVRPGGHLVVVMNHPVATSPESEPLVDPDGEILWRWGEYLVNGSWAHPAGERTVDLVHRPMGEILTTAAQAGWMLDVMIERGPSQQTIERFPEFRGQRNIPSLLGIRWTRS